MHDSHHTGFLYKDQTIFFWLFIWLVDLYRLSSCFHFQPFRSHHELVEEMAMEGVNFTDAGLAAVKLHKSLRQEMMAKMLGVDMMETEITLHNTNDMASTGIWVGTSFESLCPLSKLYHNLALASEGHQEWSMINDHRKIKTWNLRTFFQWCTKTKQRVKSQIRTDWFGHDCHFIWGVASYIICQESRLWKAVLKNIALEPH